jgi:cellulose synthase (UDP-forming)
MSIELEEAGWRSVYVPEVLASGLAPTDMSSYVTQQFRWARGCVGSIPRVIFSKLHWRSRLQYLLSAMFFLSGWTLAIYMTMPVVRLATGAQPIKAASANIFLLHFAPYFLTAIATVALAGGGAYTFSAFALVAGTYWVHILASLSALLGLKARFKVTPKKGHTGPQLAVAFPTLLTVCVLAGAAGFGLIHDRSPGTLNNVGFAGLHIAVLLRGVWPAIAPARAAPDLETAPALA